MLITENEVTNLMDLLKIPVEKRDFAELKKRIQNLMGKNDNFAIFSDMILFWAVIRILIVGYFAVQCMML